MPEKNLEDWANKNSKFIKLSDGGSIIAKYKGYNESSYRGSPTIEYKLEVDGEVKILTSSSGKLAKRMSNIPEDQLIKITRFGLATETNYEVSIQSGDEGVTPAPTSKPELDENGNEIAWDE